MTNKLLRSTHYLLTAVIVMLASGMYAAQAAESRQNAGNCHFTGTQERLVIYHAPFTSPSQLKDTLPGGVGYRVLAQSGEHFHIAVDDAYGGWVDRRSGVLSGDCDSIPVDEMPLTDYPTMCFFTLAVETAIYAEPSLETALSTLAAGGSYPVTEQNAERYYVQLDHAFGGWVSAETGELSGGCDDLPYMPGTPLAVTLSEARVWSEPNVQLGEVVSTLQPGTQVHIVSEPWPGPIQLETNLRGYWFRIALSQDTSPVGWVWAGRLGFAQLTLALSGARLWSQPDVRAGEMIADVDAGTPVTVIAGPVRGPIRLDTDTQGDWYQVRVGADTTGWMWSERLSFQWTLVPDETATATENARLWSQPDVRTGEIIAEIDTGAQITILAGPVRGPIRLDTDTQGDWYQVRVGADATGWMWSERLEFD